ncbi:hypothetical protein JJV70_20905 [Streptomyces sp. JJ66]|uniref:DUF6243 family protein n=1 Tax=Streptomyces sp. JJ66 TaxID=2803843 RepID=UPI001C55A206|nr:DUF6243 family protein [Streptomyces sp. JJ66]MBW1604518.1 hypothetical protein [Streptomyces sp. JJ66]
MSSKGRGGNPLGVGGTRRHLSRRDLSGSGRGRGASGSPQDPMAAKRELLRKLRESRG